MRGGGRPAYGRRMPLIPPAPPPLALPAAVEQPTLPAESRWKLSLYGVQRTLAVSTRTAPNECGEERGTYRFQREVRFSSARALTLRLTRIGSIPVLLSDGQDRLRLKGSAAATVSDSMVRSSCSDLNPDGSPKWVPRNPAETPGPCVERELSGYRASVRWSAGRLSFSASGGSLGSRDVGEPTICSDAVVFPALRRAVSLRQLLASRGAPVKLGQSRGSREQTRSLSSETSSRTTVYVELRRVG